MNELTLKQCVPCRGGVPPLKGNDLKALHEKLGYSWSIVNEHYLKKEFAFKNFGAGLDFVVKIGEIAEAEGHHPDIELTYSKVTVTIYTHKVDGLTESDFILAAKIDAYSSSV